MKKIITILGLLSISSAGFAADPNIYSCGGYTLSILNTAGPFSISIKNNAVAGSASKLTVVGPSRRNDQTPTVSYTGKLVQLGVELRDQRSMDALADVDVQIDVALLKNSDTGTLSIDSARGTDFKYTCTKPLPTPLRLEPGSLLTCGELHDLTPVDSNTFEPLLYEGQAAIDCDSKSGTKLKLITNLSKIAVPRAGRIVSDGGYYVQLSGEMGYCTSGIPSSSTKGNQQYFFLPAWDLEQCKEVPRVPKVKGFLATELQKLGF